MQADAHFLLPLVVTHPGGLLVEVTDGTVECGFDADNPGLGAKSGNEDGNAVQLSGTADEFTVEGQEIITMA